MAKILVTGGAGFIGSHIVDKLVEMGHQVRIFDNLEYQVHKGKIPKYLNKKAELIIGDMKDSEAIKKAIEEIDIIFHMAARVGVGQSMYQIKKYVETNVLGTANLLDALVNEKHNVKKLIVASSMSTYGEGSYECSFCGVMSPSLRNEAQMNRGDFEIYCSKCNKQLKPIGTDETKKQEITSIYALTKKDQEEMCINIGKAYLIPVVALRFFNVYGPRQSLDNPYTGVGAIFMSRIKNKKPPLIFEDGLQSRDFTSVHDIVQACILAMEKDEANYEVFNVGTGIATSIIDVANMLSKIYGYEITPEVNKKFRKGDIRHCFSDITKIKSIGYNPQISLEQGLRELVEWSNEQEAEDKVDIATKELEEKGLVG